MNYREIEDCVLRAKNGSKEALSDLLDQYKPFIFKTASLCRVKNFEVHDLVQLAYIGLINAVSKYKVNSNTFSSYAYTTIKNTINYTIRQNFNSNLELSLNTPIPGQAHESIEFLDELASDYNLEGSVIDSETSIDIRTALKGLSPQELDLINSLYYKDITLQAYATTNGLTYQHAFRKKTRILNKLNKSLLN